MLLQVAITLPWVTTHHHQTRCFAHLTVHSLVSSHPELFISTGESATYASQLLQELLSFTADNPPARRLLEACPLSLDTNFARLSDPSCLLQGRSVLIGSCESEPVECATASAIEQMSTFLEAERRSLKQQRNGSLQRQGSGASNWPGPDTTGAPADLGGQVQQGYQRKVEPWGVIGGAQARYLHAPVRQEDLLSILMGSALEFGAVSEAEGVQAPVQTDSMRAELLSETGVCALESTSRTS